jgi:hypothetical protein
MIYAIYRYIVPTILILFLTVSFSCTTGKYLKTETAGTADISGEITLFLYKDVYLIEAAVLDIEGDDYTFEMTGSGHNYTVEKSVPAELAVKKAFGSISSQRGRLRKILADNGNKIGYEVRPVYGIFRYGSSDILDVDYRIEDKKVSVTVDVKSTFRDRYYRDIFRGN